MGAPKRIDAMTIGPAGLGVIFIFPGQTVTLATYTMHAGSNGVIASMGVDLLPATMYAQCGIAMFINGRREEFYDSISQTLGSLSYPYITRILARQSYLCELKVVNRDPVNVALGQARFTIEQDGP